MKTLLLCLGLTFVISACARSAPVVPAATDTPVPLPHQVTYQIEGTSRAKVNVTYRNATGGTQQEEINIPWFTEFEAAPGQIVYLSGQLAIRGEAEITCRILVDGQIIKESTSKGQSVIASCSGSVPR